MIANAFAITVEGGMWGGSRLVLIPDDSSQCFIVDSENPTYDRKFGVTKIMAESRFDDGK